MKLGPVTKLDKTNTATSKKFVDNVMLPHCDVMIPDAWSINTIFSLTITFYLTKTKNRTKKYAAVILLL